MGLVMPTETDTIMAAVPVEDAGLGSAMNDTSREFGFALGVAVLGSVVTGVYRDRVTSGLEGLVPADAVGTLGDSLGSLNAVASQLPADVAQTVATLANESFVDAMSVGILAGMGIVALSVVIALVAMPSKMRESQAELEEDAVKPVVAGIPGMSPAD